MVNGGLDILKWVTMILKRNSSKEILNLTDFG